MTTNEYSLSRNELFGDFSTNGGQLGLSYDSVVAANVNLWDLFFAAERYLLNPDADGRIVTLPTVGNVGFAAGTGAQHGYKVNIKNVSATNSLVINSNAGATIITLQPLESVVLIGSVNNADDWYIFGSLTESSSQSVETLQDAYNNSGPTDPKIALSLTNGSVNIQSPDGLNALKMFEVTNNVGGTIVDYFSVGNSIGAVTPTIQMLSGVATNTNTIAIGRSINNGINSIAMSGNNNIFTNEFTDAIVQSYSQFTKFNGDTLEGTASSSPGQSIYFRSFNDGDTSQVITNTSNNTAYSFRVVAVGKTPASARTAHIEATFNALVDGTNDQVNVLSKNRSYIGATTITSDADIFISINTGDFRLNVVSPAFDGGPTEDMNWRIMIESNYFTSA